jgi:hypothetical protein
MADQPIKPVEHELLSSAEARDPEFIKKLFERVKGQPATAEQISDLEREIAALKDIKR